MPDETRLRSLTLDRVLGLVDEVPTSSGSRRSMT
jgi:hypothetical protein